MVSLVEYREMLKSIARRLLQEVEMKFEYVFSDDPQVVFGETIAQTIRDLQKLNLSKALLVEAAPLEPKPKIQMSLDMICNEIGPFLPQLQHLKLQAVSKKLYNRLTMHTILDYKTLYLSRIRKVPTVRLEEDPELQQLKDSIKNSADVQFHAIPSTQDLDYLSKDQLKDLCIETFDEKGSLLGCRLSSGQEAPNVFSALTKVRRNFYYDKENNQDALKNIGCIQCELEGNYLVYFDLLDRECNMLFCGQQKIKSYLLPESVFIDLDLDERLIGFEYMQEQNPPHRVSDVVWIIARI